MSSPVSTHVEESGIIAASIQNVWAAIGAVDFSWWSLVERSELVSGASPRELDATVRLIFKDGHNWVVAIRELSSIHHSITFEVIECNPASAVASAIHTISLKRVSAGPGATFIQWVSDFSSDATTETVLDSSFKRHEAFADLARSVSERA